MLLQRNLAHSNSYSAFWCQEYAWELGFQWRQQVFIIRVFWVVLSHLLVVRHLFVSHFFFSFLKSAAVKTQVLICCVLTGSFYKWSLVRNYEYFQSSGYELTKFSLETFFKFTLPLAAHERVPVSMHSCQSRVLDI